MSTELKSCFVCSGRVSVKAKHCPQCGQPWPANWGKSPFWSHWIIEGIVNEILLRMVAVFLAMAIVVLIFWIFAS